METKWEHLTCRAVHEPWLTLRMALDEVGITTVVERVGDEHLRLLAGDFRTR